MGHPERAHTCACMLTHHLSYVVCTCCVRWTCDSNWEPKGTAKPFANDYKSQRVYKNVPVTQIMIMRHKVRRQEPKPRRLQTVRLRLPLCMCFVAVVGTHAWHTPRSRALRCTRNAIEVQVCDCGITIARACDAEDART